jgi:hypothetical protein
MTLWVTEQGVVPQAEVTMAVRGIDPLTLTMKLEHYEQKNDRISSLHSQKQVPPI